MITCKVIVLVAGVASTVVIARELGPDGRGVVAVAFSFALILRQIGTLGLTAANPYYLARRLGTAERLKSNSIHLAVALGLAMVASGVVIRLLAPEVVPGISWLELSIAMAGIPFGLASLFLQSLLLGLGRTAAYNFAEVIQEIAVLIALVLAMVVLEGGVVVALIVLSAGSMLGTIACLVPLRDVGSIRRTPDLQLAQRMMGYAFRVYVATLLAFLVIRIDLLLVNGYLGASQAGIYSVDAALASGIYLFPSVVALNLFVRVADGSSVSLSAQVFRLVALAYGAVCLLTLPLVGPFIDLAYGEQFAEASDVFTWLLPGIFALGMVTILSNHFAGRGFPLAATLVWIAGLAVNIAINVAFLESEGLYMAALSSSIAYGLLLALYMRLFAREGAGYRELIPRPAEAIGLVRDLAAGTRRRGSTPPEPMGG